MEKIKLTISQSAALDALIRFASGESGFPMTTLEGYAGTGKTTLVSVLLQSIAPLMRVAVMAPTNKAVAVIKDKTNQEDVEYGTLQSFIGLRLKEREDGSHEMTLEGNPTIHQYDLAVIDECSMVSDEFFTTILTKRRSCKILFVGDPAQLPPVGDKNESPVFRLVQSRIRLSEVVRQAAGNPIIAASMQVRGAIEDQRRTSLQCLASAFSNTDGQSAAGFASGGIPSIVSAIIHEQAHGRDCRAIVWKNKTVAAINDAVHRSLHPCCQTPFAIGETVMAQAEFRAKSSEHDLSRRVRIFNSEELVVTDIYPGEDGDKWIVHLERDNGSHVIADYPLDMALHEKEINDLWAEYRRLKATQSRAEGKESISAGIRAKDVSKQAWALIEGFAKIRHIYAITTHKSQGTTFDTALVLWDELQLQRSDFDFNRMLYVAMTRASTYMAIVTQ